MGKTALKLVAEADNVEALQAELDRLESAARAAEHAAQLALIAWQNAPTLPERKRLRAEKDDAEDAALFARRDVDAYGAKVGPILQRVRREADIAKLNAKRAQLQGSEALAVVRDRGAEMLARFRKEFLRGWLVDLSDHTKRENLLRHEATELANRLGTGENFGQVKVADVLQQIVRPMNSPNWEHDGSGHVSLRAFDPNGDEHNPQRYALDISGPIFSGDK